MKECVDKASVFNPQLLSQLLCLEIGIGPFPVGTRKTQSPDRILLCIQRVSPIHRSNSCELTKLWAEISTMRHGEAARVSKTTRQQKALYPPTGLNNLLRVQYLLTTQARAALSGQRRDEAAARGGERNSAEFSEFRVEACCTLRHMAPRCSHLKLKTSTRIRPRNQRQAE